MFKFKKSLFLVFLVAAVTVITTSCYKDREELLYGTNSADCTNPDAQGPKFAAVELIIKSECISCHSPAPTGDGTSPDLSTSCYILSNYEGIYNRCVTLKTMPQAGPLSSAYQTIIKDWYDAGHKLTD